MKRDHQEEECSRLRQALIAVRQKNAPLELEVAALRKELREQKALVKRARFIFERSDKEQADMFGQY